MLNALILQLGLLISNASNPALPHPQFTPGALNPAVNQNNIDNTICVPGYARSIRPDEQYTYNLKRHQMRLYGHTGERLRFYEEDHLVPLSLGGSPTDMNNLWPQPRAGEWNAAVKDQLEYVLWHKVCAHRVSLRDAQAAIARNWIIAYQRYVTAADLQHYQTVF